MFHAALHAYVLILRSANLTDGKFGGVERGNGGELNQCVGQDICDGAQQQSDLAALDGLFPALFR